MWPSTTVIREWTLLPFGPDTHRSLGSAHAALSPWEGQNALDAAVSAYTSIAMLRQQVKPSHRIHGIFEGKDWAANGMNGWYLANVHD